MKVFGTNNLRKYYVYVGGIRRLIAKIESFLLEASLESICSRFIFYLTMNGDEVTDYNTIRNLTECAIQFASQKIENRGRKEKVVNILMELAIVSVRRMSTRKSEIVKILSS
ncbi:hypothetical protein Glove_329g70 [Diversispora epigaea]|uniref:Uncharacterized protein n=1 Tax=Diversispora epigaea TaxID=1348612 RepID=A0A397HSK7_9GLOM|nr:hypothetical protein Glove_329g70 [Diversispora epigaea]